MTVTWHEGEPRLTAPGVKAAAFPRTPWGRKGYDIDAVNTFLDQVARELEMCANETTGLREEAMRLRRRFIQRDGAGGWLADDREAHAMAVAALSEAQVAADRAVASAQEYSARLTRDAAERREAMLAEAEQVLADAQAQARAAASAAMDEPVPGQGQEPLLRAARGKVAYIDTFAANLMKHIREVLAAELLLIDGWEQRLQGEAAGRSADDAGSVPAPAPERAR